MGEMLWVNLKKNDEVFYTMEIYADGFWEKNIINGRVVWSAVSVGFKEIFISENVLGFSVVFIDSNNEENNLTSSYDYRQGYSYEVKGIGFVV